MPRSFGPRGAFSLASSERFVSTSVRFLLPLKLNCIHPAPPNTTPVSLCLGPVCSACVDNFGARPVTIFSGVMVAGGLMLSAFAPNVQFLIFSYGIVVGKASRRSHAWPKLLLILFKSEGKINSSDDVMQELITANESERHDRRSGSICLT